MDFFIQDLNFSCFYILCFVYHGSPADLLHYFVKSRTDFKTESSKIIVLLASFYFSAAQTSMMVIRSANERCRFKDWSSRY